MFGHSIIFPKSRVDFQTETKSAESFRPPSRIVLSQASTQEAMHQSKLIKKAILGEL